MNLVKVEARRLISEENPALYSTCEVLDGDKYNNIFKPFLFDIIKHPICMHPVNLNQYRDT